MSLRIINQLIDFVKVRLEVDGEDIIIKTIDIDDELLFKSNNEHSYSIEMNIKGNLYCIKHFEPTHLVQGVNYGMGPYYDLFVFNVDTNRYENV